MFLMSEDESGASSAEEVEQSAFVIEELLAVETRDAAAWTKLCASMTTRYVAKGSLKELGAVDAASKGSETTRYLVKWKHRNGAPLSHLHLSWQSAAQLRASEGSQFLTKRRRFDRRRPELEGEAREYPEGYYVDPRFTQIVALVDDAPLDEEGEDAMEEDEFDVDVSLPAVDEAKDEDADEAAEASEAIQFVTKWRSLGADCWTWETAADLDRHCEGGRAQREALQGVLKERRKKQPKPTKLTFRPKPAQVDALRALGDVEFRGGRKLRSYQVDGVDWLTKSWQRRRSAILGDEMGLGKTVQICTLISRLCTARSFALNAKAIVVVPLSTIAHWCVVGLITVTLSCVSFSQFDSLPLTYFLRPREREFEAWTDLTAVTYYGNGTARDNIERFELTALRWDVLITTYETVTSDVEFLRKTKWGFLVVDEAHRLKAAASRLAESLNSLRTGFRVLMTGTPIQNDVAELFSLLAFIDPKKFPSRSEFLDKFATVRSNFAAPRRSYTLVAFDLCRSAAHRPPSLPDPLPPPRSWSRRSRSARCRKSSAPTCCAASKPTS